MPQIQPQIKFLYLLPFQYAFYIFIERGIKSIGPQCQFRTIRPYDKAFPCFFHYADDGRRYVYFISVYIY